MSETSLLTRTLQEQPSNGTAPGPAWREAPRGGPDNEQLRQSLVRIRRLARRFMGRGLDIEDLASAGNLGLANAALRYDPSRNVKFETYADWWIRKAIYEALAGASAIRLPRHQVEKLKILETARRSLRAGTGEEPRREQLADVSGLSHAEVEKLLQLVRRTVSLEQPSSPGGDIPLAEMLPAADSECPQGSLVRRDMNRYLRLHFGELRARYREVLALRYGLSGRSPMTLREAGAEMGISREGVRQLEVRALIRLRELFETPDSSDA